MKNRILCRCTAGLIVAVLWTVCGGALCDDDIEKELEPEWETIGRMGNMTLKTERYCRCSGGDYYELLLKVHWEKTDGSKGKSVLFEGMSTGCPSVQIEKTELALSIYGNRYASEGAHTTYYYRWNARTQSLEESRTEETDPWKENMTLLKQHLKTGDFFSATARISRMGNSPNAGHTFANVETAEMFFSAYHRRAGELYRQGKKRQAADIAFSILFTPSWALFGPCDSVPEHLFWNPWFREEECLVISNTPNHVAMFNDLAFYLEEDALASSDPRSAILQAEEALTFLVKAAPDRPSALLNLADARWIIWQATPAGEAPSLYRRYIDLMTHADKSRLIPKRAIDRAAPPTD